MVEIQKTMPEQKTVQTLIKPRLQASYKYFVE
ncbi:MAG: hypothetical protein JWR87_3505 [Segetibacter sp.]|jgi:hypothetical protein|nr:hypothetical protein [Segetibacter sp.]